MEMIKTKIPSGYLIAVSKGTTQETHGIEIIFSPTGEIKDGSIVAMTENDPYNANKALTTTTYRETGDMATVSMYRLRKSQ